MTGVVVACALFAGAVNLVAGGVGGWAWYRVEPSRAFWVLLRGAQACSGLFAVLAAVVAVAGTSPGAGLFWLYAVLPLAVSFVAEQLRVLSAQAVLDARDLADAQAVGGLPEAAQRSVVLAIVRRETGTMAAAALVSAFLLARAAGTW